MRSLTQPDYERFGRSATALRALAKILRPTRFRLRVNAANAIIIARWSGVAWRPVAAIVGWPTDLAAELRLVPVADRTDLHSEAVIRLSRQLFIEHLPPGPTGGTAAP